MAACAVSWLASAVGARVLDEILADCDWPKRPRGAVCIVVFLGGPMTVALALLAGSVALVRFVAIGLREAWRLWRGEPSAKLPKAKAVPRD